MFFFCSNVLDILLPDVLGVLVVLVQMFLVVLGCPSCVLMFPVGP